MKQRHQQLLQLLSRQEWMKGRELATCLGVSTRTVRLDIEHINQEAPHIIQANRQKGYHLVAFQQNRYITPLNLTKTPQDNEERSVHLLKQLLFKEDGVFIDHFCEQCFVSAKTFELVRFRVQQKLQEYEGLSLQLNNGFLQLEGSETSKRKLYRDLLKKEVGEDFLNSSELMQVYPELDMEHIQSIIWDELKHNRYSIRKSLMPFLLLHMGIVLQRLKVGHTVQEFTQDELDLEVEYQIVRSIFSKILEETIIPEAEVVSFAKLLKAYHNSDAVESKISFRGEIVDLEEVVRQIGEQLYSIMGVSFIEQEDFTMRFQLHLQGFLERVQLNLSLPNVYVQTFKRQYPLVFDTAVSISQYLMSVFQCEMTEEEIGFIALHIGAAYMQRVKPQKLRAILIANTQYPLIAGSVSRMKEQFSHRLDFIVEQSTFMTDLSEFYDADLLISFDQLEYTLEIPTIRLGLFFNTQDEIQLIKVMNIQPDNRDELLREMGQHLIQENIVTEEFLNSVLEREKLSSTDFDYALAIPHPLRPESKQSMISIAVLKEPIQWNHFPVKLVILLALKEEDMEFMQLFLGWLGKQLDSPEKMMSLLEAKNVESFIEAIR